MLSARSVFVQRHRQALSLSPSGVSQLATKAIKANWLRKDGRYYAINVEMFPPGWADEVIKNHKANHGNGDPQAS